MTFLFYLIFTNLLPIFVIVILNAKIWIAINQPSVARRNSSVVGRNNSLSARSSVTKHNASLARNNSEEVVEKKQCRILYWVVLIFLLCQTPRTAFSIQMFFTDPREWPWLFLSPAMYASYLCTILNSSLNFITYCFVGGEFRSELVRMVKDFRRKFGCGNKPTSKTIVRTISSELELSAHSISVPIYSENELVQFQDSTASDI